MIAFAVGPEKTIQSQPVHCAVDGCEGEAKKAGMSEELWKAIDGLEGYDVSSLGRIRSWHTRGVRGHLARKEPVIRPTFLNRRGYPRLTFGSQGFNSTVHRLVLEAFVGPRPEGMEAAHLNGIRTDARLENLRWVTAKENASHKLIHGTGTRGERVNTAKLTEGDVRLIRRLFDLGVRRSTLGRVYRLSKHAIYQVTAGRSWKHVGVAA